MSEDSRQNYELEIEERQLQVLMDALDFYMRIGLGQFSEIKMLPNYSDKRSDELEVTLDLLHHLLTGLGKNAYHGITSPNVDDSYRIACDIRSVIRHRLSWDKNPEGGWTVNFDEPRHYLKKMPLILIRKK